MFFGHFLLHYYFKSFPRHSIEVWVTECFPKSYAICCAVVFPKDPFSIAVSIILFPLIIDVVQMMIRFRAGVELLA